MTRRRALLLATPALGRLAGGSAALPAGLRLAGGFAALPAVAASAQAPFLDDAGRAVALPGGPVRRVHAAGPPAAILLHALAPDLLTGWPARPPSPAEAAFLPEASAKLPEVGRLTGRDNTANLEALLRERPDLVLDYGSVRPTFAALMDRVQAQTGIPAMLLDGALAKIPLTLRRLGAAIGRDAEPLAAMAGRILAESQRHAATLRARGRPRVLYLRGPRGTETGVAGSINTEIIEFAGAENVAASALGAGSLVPVSVEQAFAWNPDWIISIHPDFPAFARQDRLWSALPAVRAGRLAAAPFLPFGWVDFPPSVNRLLGLLWLPVLWGLAPREALPQAVSDFHAAFLHRRPDAAQIAALLRPALP